MAAVADLVDIGGAEALLNRDVALLRCLAAPQEVRRELLHPGGRQKDGRVVVGNEAGRGLQMGIARLEERDEVSADLVARTRRHAWSEMLALCVVRFQANKGSRRSRARLPVQRMPER